MKSKKKNQIQKNYGKKPNIFPIEIVDVLYI